MATCPHCGKEIIIDVYYDQGDVLFITINGHRFDSKGHYRIFGMKEAPDDE